MSTAESDYYTILGVSPKSDAREIRRAYLTKAREFHPDRHPNATEAEKQQHNADFRQAKEAYDNLSDECLRSNYDAKRSAEGNNGARYTSSNNYDTRSQSAQPQPQEQQQQQQQQKPNGTSWKSYTGSAYTNSNPYSTNFGSGFGASPFGHTCGNNQQHYQHQHTFHTSGGFGSSGNNPFQSSYGSYANNGGWKPRSSETPRPSNGRRTGHQYPSHHSSRQDEYAHKQQTQQEQERQEREEKRRRRQAEAERQYREQQEQQRRERMEQQRRRQAESERQYREQQAQAWMQRQREREEHKRRQEQSHRHRQERSRAWDSHRTQGNCPQRSFGKTQTGEDCKRCIQQGCYCWQHKYQDPNDPENRRSGQASSRQQKAPDSSQQNDYCRPTNSRRSTSRQFDVTQKGNACKRCIKLGGLCYQHQNQM